MRSVEVTGGSGTMSIMGQISTGEVCHDGQVIPQTARGVGLAYAVKC